jgi:uncharacterized membrane protein
MSQAIRRLPALLAAAGLLFSLILEVVHVRAYLDPSTDFCSVGTHFDCAGAALSRFSVVLGVPLPVWGAAGFLAISAAALQMSALLVPLTGAAALASVGLFVVELTQVRTLCLLCSVVHLIAFASFAVAWRLRRELTAVTRADAAAVLGGPAALLLAAFLLVPTYWNLFSWKGDVRLPHGKDAEGHPWIGAENPTVVVDEYSDYSCPHCAHAQSHMLQVLANHAKKLRLVHHDLPRMACPKLPSMAHCQPTRAALCADEQSKFWEMDAWLFAHAPGRASVDLVQAARDVGLDPQRFATCTAAQETFDRADAAHRLTARQGIINAPTFVIDGKRFVGQAVFDELAKRL